MVKKVNNYIFLEYQLVKNVKQTWPIYSELIVL